MRRTHTKTLKFLVFPHSLLIVLIFHFRLLSFFFSCALCVFLSFLVVIETAMKIVIINWPLSLLHWLVKRCSVVMWFVFYSRDLVKFLHSSGRNMCRNPYDKWGWWICYKVEALQWMAQNWRYQEIYENVLSALQMN